MTTAHDHLSKADTVTIAAIEVGVPMLVESPHPDRQLPFHDPQEIADDLEPRSSPQAKVSSHPSPAAFSRPRAVRAVMTEVLVQPEGQLRKLKLVKRQM